MFTACGFLSVSNLPLLHLSPLAVSHLSLTQALRPIGGFSHHSKGLVTFSGENARTGKNGEQQAQGKGKREGCGSSVVGAATENLATVSGSTKQ